jgi:hypothetical protein
MDFHPAQRLALGKALLCLAAAFQVGAATAAPVLDTSTHVTLGYRLIDNDLGDGIAPSLTFLSDSNPLLQAVNTQDPEWSYQFSPFAGDVFSASGSYSPALGVSVQTTGSTIDVHNQLDADKFTELATAGNGNTVYHRNASLSASGQRFTLSANTTLEVFATVDFQTSVDKDAVLALVAGGTPGINTVLTTTTGTVSGFFQAGHGLTTSHDAYQPLRLFETAGVYAGTNGAVIDTNVPSAGQNFLLSVTNHENLAQAVTLTLDVRADTRLLVNTLPVPEPSTLWLAALGLGGIWVARRANADTRRR